MEAVAEKEYEETVVLEVWADIEDDDSDSSSEEEEQPIAGKAIREKALEELKTRKTWALRRSVLKTDNLTQKFYERESKSERGVPQYATEMDGPKQTRVGREVNNRGPRAATSYDVVLNIAVSAFLLPT